MIHPNRTYLLQLKEKKKSAVNSLNILKARRLALIMEFLNATRPFLKSRQDIRERYGKALQELSFSLGHEGEQTIHSLTAVNQRDIQVNIEDINILGVKFKNVRYSGVICLTPQERNYDYQSTTPHVEEAIDAFEKIVEAILENAAYESRLKKLGEAILRVSRKSRTLEQRMLPRLVGQIKNVSQYIGEREREEYYRLKRFKDKHQWMP